MSSILEGLGQPKIVFADSTNYTFPEPVGSGKEGLRVYDFEQFQRDQYWSEGGRKNTVGKKFIFVANLTWISINKDALKKLWKANKDAEFTFYLNIDKTSIYYKCEVANLDFRFFKGTPGHAAGYTVNLQLRGTELLNSPGYLADDSGSGYGTGWGVLTGNQSP